MSQLPSPDFNIDTTENEATSKSSERKSGAKKLLSSLSATAGAAAKLVALQTERTKLTTLTLPATYRALGKDCVQHKRHLDCVPELMQQLRSVMGDLTTLSETAKGQPAAQSFTDKAKAAGKQAADLARQKQLGMKRDSLLGEIGKAIHNLHGEASGQTELVVPIRDSITRLAHLDADISRLSEVGKGSFLTPKRLLVGGGIAVLLLVGMMVAGSGMFGEKSDTSGRASAPATHAADYAIPRGMKARKQVSSKSDGKVTFWEEAEGFVRPDNVFVKHGKVVVWFDEAKTRRNSEFYYINDTMHGQFTFWDREGNKRESGFAVNGKYHGKRTTSSESGTLESEEQYNNGVKEGTWRTWSDSGSKLSEATYREGKRVGTVTWWNDKGEVIRKIEYDQGGNIQVGKMTCHDWAIQVTVFCKQKRWTRNGYPESGYDASYAVSGATSTQERIFEVLGRPASIANRHDPFGQLWQYNCNDGVAEIKVVNLNDLSNNNRRDEVRIVSGCINVRYGNSH